MSQQQTRHAANNTHSGQSIGASDGNVGNARKNDAKVPKIQQVRITDPGTHFRQPSKASSEVEVCFAQSVVDANLLSHEKQHPHSEADFGKNNREEVLVDEPLLSVGCKHEKPRIRCEDGHTGHAWG